MKKLRKSFRLSTVVVDKIKDLKEKTGLSETSIIEIAINEYHSNQVTKK